MTKSYNLNEPESGQLPPLLEEFRAALQDNIETAKGNSSNTSILLHDGHKVGQQGRAYQYEFLMDSVIKIPEDISCALVISGQPPIEVTIVSVEKLHVVINLEYDLGPSVPTAYLQTDLSMMLRRLIGRIENNSSTGYSADSKMADTSPGGTLSETPSDIGNYPSRTLALESALGRNLTVIWGLPRTGKTLTLGVIAEQLYKSGRTVLIVSHTDTAVDRAIKHVAKSLQNYLEQGVVLRAGEVRDNTLKSVYPDVPLKQHVEHRSKELVEHKAGLIAKKEQLVNELNVLDKSISALKWLESSNSDIQLAQVNVEQLKKLESQFALDEKTWAELKLQQPRLFELQSATSRVLTIRSELAVKIDQQNNLNNQLSNLNEEINRAQADVKEQGFRLKIADRIAPLRIERAAYPQVSDQKAAIRALSTQIVKSTTMFEEIQRRYNLANKLLSQINNSGYLGRALKRLPKAKEQEALVNEIFTQLSALGAEKKALNDAQTIAKNKLNRILELESSLSGHEDIGSSCEETAKKLVCENSLHGLEDTKLKFTGDLEALSTEIRELQEEEAKLAASLGSDPEIINLEVRARLSVSEDLQVAMTSCRFNLKNLQDNTALVLNRLLSQLAGWMTIPQELISEDKKLDFIVECRRKLASQYNPTDLPSLIEKADLLRWGISKLVNDMSAVDENLTNIESNVIKNAAVIGATLTNIYLSDIIQARRFDTVIVDEVSMAPIPTLWVAALLSNRNLIIMGDIK